MDVILVLAGGLNYDGTLPEWVIRRLNDTIDIHNLYKIPIICLGGGTYHKPPVLNERGFVIHESTACTNYLKSMGNISPSYIYKEWCSYDTIGNVYFSLINHISLMNVKNILIITSEFHMQRVRLLFEWIYNLSNIKYNLYFHSSSDKGLENFIKERINREKQSIHHIKYNLIPNINNMTELHHWLYIKHNAYSSADNNIEIITDSILKTY